VRIRFWHNSSFAESLGLLREKSRELDIQAYFVSHSSTRELGLHHEKDARTIFTNDTYFLTCFSFFAFPSFARYTCARARANLNNRSLAVSAWSNTFATVCIQNEKDISQIAFHMFNAYLDVYEFSELSVVTYSWNIFYSRLSGDLLLSIVDFQNLSRIYTWIFLSMSRNLINNLAHLTKQRDRNFHFAHN